MATVIDSLIVTLGLDSKDVDAKAPGVRNKLADLEKSASKTEHGVKGIGTASKGTASELTVLSAKLGSFLAVLGGTAAVRAFVKDTIETNTQLYFLSRNLEMNTQKLFAWGAAAQEIGGSKGSIQNFMRTIAGMPGELLIGKMPQLLPLFARLGINFREPFDQIMVDLSKRFAGMDRKVAFSFGMASGIPEDVMNLILQGPGAMQGALARTKGFGPTGKEAESAAQLKLRFTDLELLIVKIGYDLLYKVTPHLEKFLDILQKIGVWAQRHEKIVAIIAGVAAGLLAIAGLAGAIGAVSLAWTALSGAFVAALPVLAVVGIVAALGAAILLLWQDYKVWSEGGKSLFNWGDFAEGIDVCSTAFDGLADKIEKATDRYGKWLKSHGIDLPAIGSAIGGVITGSSAAANGQALRKKFDVFMATHSDKTLSQDAINGFILHAIYEGEGFYDYSKGQNIPQRAHNPGDIEYGDFAKSHGATGYVLAQGGKKIATFANDDIGKAAARALLGTKGYASLSPEQKLSRWQTGSSLLNGVSNASRVPASVSSATNTSSTSNDNSKVTHIGTINMSNPAGSSAMTPSMVRGMDWNTLLTQQNFGLY
jgi:hypothetical protein